MDTATQIDFSKYIGIPFKERGRNWDGVDCWGLVYLLYSEELNIELPRYDIYEDTKDVEQNSNLILSYMGGWSKVLVPNTTDALLFRLHRFPAHVGIHMHKGLFIHADRRCGVVCERLSSANWKRRFLAAYQYDL